MFTNWLTGTSGSVANHNNNSTASAVAAATLSSTAAAATAGIMSTPPDVVLEVGAAPPNSSSVRFVAHSIVLGMHSGYLRSAIRLDENVAGSAASLSGGGGSELVLYLSNVTAEQFAPLLTYMYTGYLDLNVENIFGVLLATHVLHMPRALEICRSFLARAQTEGYLSNGLPPSATATATATTGSSTNNGKIIRPIPSKATLPNFGFLPTAHPPAPPPPSIHAHQLSATAMAAAAANNSYKSLQQAYAATSMIVGGDSSGRQADYSAEVRSTRNTHDAADEDDDDEDEEVFIDSISSNSETDNEAETEIDCTISVTSDSSATTAAAAVRANLLAARKSQPESATKSESYELLVAEKPTPLREEKRVPANVAAAVRSSRGSTAINALQNTKKRSGGGERRKQQRHKTAATVSSGSGGGGGLQVAKAPIPASQLPDANEGGPKFIIDVASCDGPVRFRRILNTAYGHKPEAYAAVAANVPERTQQSVSLSFHQQMAKTISQQRQLQHAEESENSESSGGGGGGNNGGKASKSHASNEIYVCVYCKHTFKSQYCYQKHAKRHLNPLSLNCTSTSGSGGGGAVATESREKLNSAAVAGVSGGGAYRRLPSSSLPIVKQQQQQSATELLLRREVRPLDMNVQYYPCKTCGSKFPSYYFVHKHRKMCHAEEEATATAAVASATDTTSRETNGDGCGGGGVEGEAGAAGVSDHVGSANPEPLE